MTGIIAVVDWSRGADLRLPSGAALNSKLVLGFSAARVAYAAAVIAAPRRAAGPWLGADAARGGGRVAARALVARDALLAIGLADAARREAPLRPWAAALVASDLADIAATIADREQLPKRAVPGTVALAGAAALAGAGILLSAER